jgi:hypothetical protein
MCRGFHCETGTTCKKRGKISVERRILRSITLSRYRAVRSLYDGEVTCSAIAVTASSTGSRKTGLFRGIRYLHPSVKTMKQGQSLSRVVDA